MKFVKGVSLFFIYPVACIVLGMYAGIRLYDFFYPGHVQKEKLSYTMDSVNIPNVEADAAKTDSTSQFIAVNYAAEEVICADTEYIIEEYDTRRDTLIENKVSVPQKYLGMNRDEFVNAMELYSLSPPLSEQVRGFIGLEVRSFSKSRVVIRMNYAYVEPSESFYIKVEDNVIVVYCDDEETVYMYTDISADMLPGNVQTKVSIGMFVEDEEALYHFLETYSS